ncbi:hypothetical protein [Streptomyces sp. HB132]|uniref:hypothetical protein n=1 Tax=Streptomyces sp. HB132 TaxID=767388 RepID=UPI001962050A|nr:hypothetical protein [Streptomyces sp. HB132]MBM7439763.1 hypothetical protein [Streptomyces sp. HB132]
MRITAHGSAVGAAMAVVLLTAVTGCSSGSDGGGSGSGLLTGLGTLAGDTGSKQVTFLDTADVRKLSKGDAKRFAWISQSASPLLNASRPSPLGEKFTVDQIDRAVDTPEAGHWEGSFDVTAIAKSLESSGYTRSEKDGQKVWTHPEQKVTIQVSGDEISYSTRDADPLSAVTPEEGSSLADRKEFRRAAECLGDVYRADFNPLSSTDPVRLSALGQQAETAAKNTEVLCFVVKDEATARKLETNLRTVVRDERPTFDGTKVTVEKGDQPVVRAVVPDTATQRPGRLVISDMELWMAAAT